MKPISVALAAAGVAVSFVAFGAVPCPLRVVVIGCRIEPGHYVEDMAREGVGVFGAKDWQDISWKLDPKIGGLDCTREVVPLEDAALYAGVEGGKVSPLNTNLGDISQCATVALQYGPKWAALHPGYFPIIACPARVVNERPDGSEETIAWQDAPCPTEIAGLPVVCREDSAI